MRLRATLMRVLVALSSGTCRQCSSAVRDPRGTGRSGLAGAALAVQAPVRAGLDRRMPAAIPRTARLVGQPRRQRGQHRVPQAAVERRIDEHDVEAARQRRAQPRQRVGRAPPAPRRRPAGARPWPAALRPARGSRSTSTASRAPRDSASRPSAPLPANRSSTRAPRQHRLQPVEQGFADAVGSRAQARQRPAPAAACRASARR